MFLKNKTENFTEDYSAKIGKFKELTQNADAVVIGAGAGLSTSAGLNYGGQRFEKLFPDFIEKYKLTDMYSSAFYPFETREEFWAYFSRHIYHNRYESEVNSLYSDLFNIIKDKNYFVITTNADHLFIKSGFDKERLFYTQGDYGLFQCSKPCHGKNYDNKEQVYEMVEKQKNCKIPTQLIPKCPVCGEEMSVNLRKDDTFVEDDGWYNAMDRYESFVKENINKNIVFLELGIGYNTPSIIKYPFWQMTHGHKNANFICINYDDIRVPKEIIHKSLCFKADIKNVIDDLK
ncbi:MAG: Sir2 silent information regulator family NAD-dependent deacetylase [Clostridia bacterium]